MTSLETSGFSRRRFGAAALAVSAGVVLPLSTAQAPAAATGRRRLSDAHARSYAIAALRLQGAVDAVVQATLTPLNRRSGALTTGGSITDSATLDANGTGSASAAYAGAFAADWRGQLRVSSSGSAASYQVGTEAGGAITVNRSDATGSVQNLDTRWHWKWTRTPDATLPVDHLADTARGGSSRATVDLTVGDGAVTGTLEARFAYDITHDAPTVPNRFDLVTDVADIAYVVSGVLNGPAGAVRTLVDVTFHRELIVPATVVTLQSSRVLLDGRRYDIALTEADL